MPGTAVRIRSILGGKLVYFILARSCEQSRNMIDDEIKKLLYVMTAWMTDVRAAIYEFTFYGSQNLKITTRVPPTQVHAPV